MVRTAHFAVLFVAATSCSLAAAAGCKSDNDPVDIPFSGVDVTSSPETTLPTAMPEPSVDESAKAPKPAAAGNRPSGGGIAFSAISGCCNTLAANARSATDEGKRAVNDQAAKVCYARSRDVAEGRLTREQALAQVRSSLLDAAPAACR